MSHDHESIGMQILIAEDNPVSCRLLQATLEKLGYEIMVTRDGSQACQILQQPDAPSLAILDWMMPGMDGPDICRKVRETADSRPVHLILLTTRSEKEDIVKGLEAGADDYITKPFNHAELRARVEVGVRIIQLQQKLAFRVQELQETLAQVRQLQGLLPICSYCRKIRDDKNYWQQVESYITTHLGAEFSHTICPSCYAAEVEKLTGR